MNTRLIGSVLATSSLLGSLLVAVEAHAASGKEVYEATCAACHATGAAGAPKLGDKGGWAPRLATGVKALQASALKGKGVMPPKGGNAGLSDADVIAAADYLIAQSK